jgi:hypothetical protein
MGCFATYHALPYTRPIRTQTISHCYPEGERYAGSMIVYPASLKPVRALLEGVLAPAELKLSDMDNHPDSVAAVLSYHICTCLVTL